MEQQQGTKTSAGSEKGFLTSEFWVNGGVAATVLVLMEKAQTAIEAAPASAWPIAIATGAACLSLAGTGVGYALMRTRRKESGDLTASALQAMELDEVKP